MKLIKKIISARVFKLSILIILQIVSVFVLFSNIATYKNTVYNIVIFIGICLVISVFAKDDLNPVYKLLWIMVITLIPVIGTLIYLLWGDRKVSKRNSKAISESIEKCKTALLDYPYTINPDFHLSGGEKASAKYLLKMAYSPVYGDTTAEFFSCGEHFFERFLQELEKAEKSIFIEYFIIKTGYMWDKIYEILERKAKEGLDVRIIYDSFGSMLDLPEDFWDNMQKHKIKCYPFNKLKFSWILSDYTFLNHRDHRKICIIDGNIGFTGGINIADEYININSRCGKWKDTAVMLKGNAVFSLTTSFLKMWEFVSKEMVSDYSVYKPTKSYKTDFYVQPYDDSPLDVENVSENAYFNVIYHARNYVYITTPYLIIDNEMVTALSLAAKSGVDVKIITPGIPDKKYVYLLTQSFYPELIRAGVKIYEFLPGFIHAKMFVRDDEQAIVGTANMDYRSLYLHFENCCAFYGGNIVKDVKEDFEKTLLQCREITEEYVKKVPLPKKIAQLLLKFFAPIM